jgi:hypothetical protein
MKTIKVFGRMVDREEAFDIIVNYWVCCLFCPEDLNALWGLLTGGWKPFKEWTDSEIENYIAEHCDAEHQRDGEDYRRSAASPQR